MAKTSFLDLEIQNYISYLKEIRNMSANTCVSYNRDLKKLSSYFGLNNEKLFSELKSVELTIMKPSSFSFFNSSLKLATSHDI